MTIGSTANIANALYVLRSWTGPAGLEPVERLALVLLSDAFGMGACEVDEARLHPLLGTKDPAGARAAVQRLADLGLIHLSAWHGGVAFAGSTLSSDVEIEHVRRQLGCRWPFVRGTHAGT